MAKKKVRKSAKRKTKTVKKTAGPKKQDDQKLFAFLAVFLTIIGFIIAILIRKDDKYVIYYAKQGLVLFIVFVIAGIFASIPFIEWVGTLLMIVTLVLWVIGWINALSGKEKPLFLISELADKIKL